MSLSVDIPYRNIGNESIECWYFAANNPIIVNCERKDFTITTTQDDGSGNTQINVSGTLPSLTVGGTVFVNAGTFGSGLCGNFEILSSTSSAIVINEPYTAPFSGGYVNLITDRDNYYVYTRIQCVAPIIFGTFGEIEYIYRQDRTNSLGVLKMDIHENILTKFSKLNESAYDTININDDNNCCQFNIEFKEVWDGGNGSWVSAPSLINAVNAAMQIRHIGGSNMMDYMPIQSANTKSKFLSASTRMRWWTDFPFDLSYFLGESVLNGSWPTYLARHEVEYLGSTVGTVTDTSIGFVSTALNSQIQRTILSNSYAANTDRVNVSIIYNNSPTIYTNITEEVQVFLHECTHKNPVYIAWLNNQGGWNYWLFNVKQLFGRKTGIDALFSKFYEDMEDQETTHSITGKSVDPYMVCGADSLNSYDILLMNSLISSKYVLMLTNNDTWDTEGPIWNEVRVEAADFKIQDTKKTLQGIEMKFLLPEFYV